MSNGEATLKEKDFGYANDPNHEHLSAETENDTALHKIRTAGSISISPELFEKLYLSPRDAAAKDGLRRYVGNPTPIALTGFLLSLTPLSCDLMGWRGAGNANGSASIGAYYFFGGVLMIIGAVGEWLTGNTFPTVVFASFGAFWMTFAATLQDNIYHAQTNYHTDPTGVAVPYAEGQAGFYNAFAFVLLWMGFLCFIYLIASLRTNIAFVLIFFTLVLAFGFLAGAFWQYGQANNTLAGKLVIGGGACAFVTSLSGWWIFAALVLASTGFPLSLPVGDLSHIIKAKDASKAA